MASYSNLLEAFNALNERKRWDPDSFDEGDRAQWKEMRREIERVLFQKDSDPNSDSREFLRVPVTLEARYWTRNELKDRYIPVLGEGGLFISTVDPLPVGTKLDMEIVITQKKLLFRVNAEVVWSNNDVDPAKRGMGLKFIELTYEQKQIIYGLVDDNLRQRFLERRRVARIDARLKVEYTFAEGHIEGYTKDLGIGGLFISTDQQIPVGEKIRLVLHVPGEQPIVSAVGEVVRAVRKTKSGDSQGVGIHFVDLDKKAEQAIRRYMGLRVTGQIEPTSQEIERRRYTRLKHRLKLRFKVVHSIETAYSRDISTGGVFIHTQDPPPKGSVIQVTLVHPATLQELVIAGRVARVVLPDPNNPSVVSGVGVAFEEIDEEKRELLLKFLEDFVALKLPEISSP